MQLTDPNELFELIQQRISRHKTHKKGATRQRYDALVDTYLLGTFLIRKGALKEFVQARNPKLWNKTAEKKPFQPLMQLAFADFPKATISQQSTILSHCKEIGRSVEDFKDLLHSRGSVKLYEDAQNHNKKKTFPKQFELSAEEESTWLADQFGKLSSSVQVDVDGDGQEQLGLQEGEPFQLAAKWQNGKLHILQNVEMDKKAQDAFVRRIIGKPPKQSLNRLGDKNLFGLFKAADIFARFSNNPLDFVDEQDWQDTASSEIPNQLFAKTGLLFEFKDQHWVARTIGQLPTFRCVSVVIQDNLGPLDPAKRYFLSSAQCHLLAEQFLYEGEWELLDMQGGPICECVPRSISISFLDFDQDLSDGAFDLLDSARRSECSFKLPLNNLRRAAQWREEHKAKGLVHIPFPLSFALVPKVGGKMELAFPLNPMMNKPIAVDFHDNGSSDFEDRFLLAKDLKAICDLALDYDLQFNGAVFSTFEPCNGLELDFNDGTASKIALPLAISVPGDLGQITESLQ